MLVDTFVNAIFVYDDKLLLTFNFKDGQRTFTLADTESIADESGSNLVCSGVPIKDGVNDRFTPSFIYALEQGLERFNRNMPVAYCCNQFKNWLLPKFLPVPRKGKNANESLPVYRYEAKERIPGESF